MLLFPDERAEDFAPYLCRFLNAYSPVDASAGQEQAVGG